MVNKRGKCKGKGFSMKMSVCESVKLWGGGETEQVRGEEVESSKKKKRKGENVENKKRKQ